MGNVLINLKDSYIEKFKTDTESYDGCETCDYGSSYVNELLIVFKDEELRVEASQMYDYPLSDGYLMTLMLGNFKEIEQMTEKEFVQWFCGKVAESRCELKVDYTGKQDLMEMLEEWEEK